MLTELPQSAQTLQ